jgi:hypothetical protein
MLGALFADVKTLVSPRRLVERAAKPGRPAVSEEARR